MVAELHDALEETEVLHSVETVPAEGTVAELEWATSSDGMQAHRRAGASAHCVIEFVKRTLVLVGFPHERERGREYARWVVLARSEGGGHGCNLSVPDADMREDISILLVQDLKASRITAEKLWPIERETNTLCVFDDGGGTALDVGMRRLLVCGCDSTQRELAICRINAMLESVATVFDSCSSANAAAMAARIAPQHGVMDDRGAPLNLTGRPRPATNLAEAEPQAKRPRLSDPKEVLATIAWPNSINQWGSLQNKIWEGHAKLPPGWIRVWSKSQDSEYYLRLKDMKTTFNFDEME